MSGTLFSGGCQCGAVRYRAGLRLESAHICHCRMCQKAAGNLFMALVNAPLNKLQWTRGRPGLFRSSEHTQRGFCADCGTPLVLFDDDAKHCNLTIGSLDEPEKVLLHGECGMEGRLPQVGQIGHILDSGTTENSMVDTVAAIRASNRQHPDHDTGNWPLGAQKP